MLDKAIPDAAVLRQLLRYEPETWKLFWLPRPREMFKSENSFLTWNSRFSGKEAFTYVDHAGYKTGNILSVKNYAHRIIWTMENGGIPHGKHIDHINGDKTDNRMSNLRLATQAENNRNSCLRSDNKIGVKGVSWLSSRNKFVADICVNGARKRIGYFDTKEEAKAAYVFMAESLHGQFALHNRPNP